MNLLFLIAQLPPPESAQAIGWIALAGTSIVVGLNQVMKFTDRWKEHPPMYKTYSTKEEHKEFQVKMDTELGRERGARKQIHQEVSDLQRDISAIKGETSRQTTDIADLKLQIIDTNKRVDAVPERTIALMRGIQHLGLNNS